MVGTGTISDRVASHTKEFGASEVLAVWTLAHAITAPSSLTSWRIVEQLEARLQYAPEFQHPEIRLRVPRPGDGAHSYEWFVDDQRVLDAVSRWAAVPVAVPIGWAAGDR